MNTLPIAKTKNIISQKAGAEILLYNLKTNQVFCLNETSAKVWSSCDGKTNIDEFLKLNDEFSESTVWLALDELHKQNLLEQGFKRPSNLRRKLVIGLVASTFLLPAISTLIAPTAANAQSIVGICGNGFATPPEQCDDGNLNNGDGCDNNCTFTSCGNGIVTGSETCDDGNLNNGDSCSMTCQIEP